MKRKFSTRIIAGIATSAVLAVGSLSFTAISGELLRTVRRRYGYKRNGN